MAMVSLRRLCKFLNSDVVEHDNIQLGSQISLENATVTWPSRESESEEARNRKPFKLTEMNLQIPDEARFVLVCGATGAGKVGTASSCASVLADSLGTDLVSAESPG
jgi:hypothetical protein